MDVTSNSYAVVPNTGLLALPIFGAGGVDHLLCDASVVVNLFNGERLVFQRGNRFYQWNGDYLVHFRPALPPATPTQHRPDTHRRT
jgi:hypothetical protein